MGTFGLLSCDGNLIYQRFSEKLNSDGYMLVRLPQEKVLVLYPSLIHSSGSKENFTILDFRFLDISFTAVHK